MKINIEIDLTPEEAREVMGMPSLDRMQAYFADAVKNQWPDENNPLALMWEAFMKQSREAFEIGKKATEKNGDS